ncbi:CBS domain-containing protein [Protofrankia symbiont of Coriaria ruscifolia]|uniref:Putative signal transduction protein with CBS domains n=1 Tax=Candidatus Protofrankia californiensis TaxID=1839754 RepID=A0A1C3PDY3_9ACTN|nr:CBS domain-containing protein [Protofrankia symbiont of Coriaria ruscifolia]SBW28024.1 putative signal transduction protein with CBS domains [Candidatus Protofrankia californiensis]
MRVSDGMTVPVLVIGPKHTLRQAARLMAVRKVGAAIVRDVDGEGYSILTERDVLLSVADGQNPDAELVGDHIARDVVFADPGWSLAEAAGSMLRGGFRHLIVCDRGEVAGVLSMRDVVRCWSEQRASV